MCLFKPVNPVQVFAGQMFRSWRLMQVVKVTPSLPTWKNNLLLSNNITFPTGAGTGRPSKETFPLAPGNQTGGKWECPGEQHCACLCTRHCVQPRSKIRKGRWDRRFWDSLFIYLFSANSQLLKGKVTRGIGRVLPSFVFLLCPCHFFTLSLISLLLEMGILAKTVEKLALCPVKLSCVNVRIDALNRF